jgi:hypothetical protein
MAITPKERLAAVGKDQAPLHHGQIDTKAVAAQFNRVIITADPGDP